MEDSRKETSFDRMNIAVREMVNEDLGVEAIYIKSHTSQTIKIIAYPDAVNTVDVLVPYQIFMGAQTNQACKNWNVVCWKLVLRQLCMEFAVKDCSRARLMVRNAGAPNPRTYAEFFWKSVDSMGGWNIILPETSTLTQVKGIEARNESKLLLEAASVKIDVQNAYELLGIKFACL